MSVLSPGHGSPWIASGSFRAARPRHLWRRAGAPGQARRLRAAGPPHPASASSPHRVPAHGLAVRRTLYL